MKTTLMLNIVKRMGSGVPTLYHSSDSDDFTMATRTNSLLTGVSIEESELMMFTDVKTMQQGLLGFDHVRWSFNSAPTIEDLWHEAEAFREIYGEYPRHTVIDILSGIDCEGVPEYNYSRLMTELNIMAREQETSITVVHHTSESAKTGTPPPSSALMGKIAKLPTLVLTLWGDSQAGTIDVAVVKNRFGPMDSEAKRFFHMKVTPDVCLVEEGEGNGPEVVFRDGVGVPEDLKVSFDD